MLRLTLDDVDTRAQALSDPEGLVARADRMSIDEVQRAPDLLIAIKRAVDLDRRPGRFVLTGAANLLAIKQVQESLAGRASYVRSYLHSANHSTCCDSCAPRALRSAR
jgi:uncharacterized protein